jgi:exopolyphosphatase / guanosine-5'-triphosphate,3'-diphosphate pyrophosphatase
MIRRVTYDSAAIVPRWEWRTFGASFGPAEERLAGQPSTRVQDSDEVYVLSEPANVSAKFRDGVMDVKRLEQVNEDGLEQWRPVMKAEFPLSADDIRALLTAIGADSGRLAKSQYTLDELLSEVVAPNPHLRSVEVHKRREHYTFAGCMAELTEMRAAGAATRTMAVESEDPARVIDAVRELGLESRRNVSVPRGLAALVGFGARRYAVIDVGTNSVKLHIGERALDGEWRTIADRAEITRLGEGLDESGRLMPEPVARTVDAIAAMAGEAEQNGVEAIAAVGTAGLRMAPNRDELIAAVRERTGVEVEVLSGEEESRLAYLAVASSLDLGDGSLALFDTGGGSSQFTFGHGAHVDERFSVDVGAVRFTERYGLDQAVSEETVRSVRAAIEAELERIGGRAAPDVLVGIGGAVTNLAAVKHRLAAYDPDIVRGTILDRADVDSQIELYRTRPAAERREIVGLQPKRSDVILAGACVVRTVMELLAKESLMVSDRGLRHGLLVERFGRPD